MKAKLSAKNHIDYTGHVPAPSYQYGLDQPHHATHKVISEFNNKINENKIICPGPQLTCSKYHEGGN